MTEAAAAVETPAAGPAPTVPGQMPDLNVDIARASAEIGTDLFGKTEEEDDKDTPAQTPAPAAAPVAAPPAVAAVQPPATPATAPATVAAGDWSPEQTKALEAWRPESRELLKKLPPELKPVLEEIVKREGDMLKGFEQIKSESDLARSFQQTIKPYLPAMQFYNIDPLKMTNQLLATQQVLAFGTLDQKLNIVRKLVKDYQIPLDQLGDTSAPQIDPALQSVVAPLQAEIGQLRSTLTAEQQRQQNERRQANEREVAEFTKTHPYFDELSDLIAQLLESKVATTLADAYDKAMWQHPGVRAKELARQDKERSDAAAKKAEEDAARARAATGANVSTSAKPQVSTTAPAVGSMDDTLHAALAAIKKRESGT